MRRFWICLAISLVCHALFFPDFLHAMLTAGASYKVDQQPARVSLKLAPRKARLKPPAPKPPAPPKAKPVPKPKPQPQTKPKITPPPKPVVTPRPQTKPPVPRPEPKTPPRQAPRPSQRPPVTRVAQPPRGATRPPRSNRRLTTPSTRPNTSGVAVPAPPSSDSGGRAGVLPPPTNGPDAPVGDGDNGTGHGPVSPDPGPVSSGPPPGPGPSDPGHQSQPKSDPPKPPPESKPTPPPPKPPEEPDRSASSPPKVREASIEVPILKLPANLRRESLKTTLQVRVVIEADGSADFKLSETSGNPDVDDYVLEQLRKVAIVTTALDDQGQPKRSMKRVRVDIEVD